jgi:hypothetical protein
MSKLHRKTSQALINSKYVKGLLFLFSSIYLFEFCNPLSPPSLSLSLSATADGPTATPQPAHRGRPNTHYLLTLFVQACITHRVRFCCRHPSGRCSVPHHHTANCQQRTRWKRSLRSPTLIISLDGTARPSRRRNATEACGP